MTKLSPLANRLLEAFGAEPALIGDLEESARAGRSPGWIWVQVLGIVLMASLRQGLKQPIYAARALVIGWSVLLIPFELFDLVSWNLRMTAYRTGQWMPFRVSAFLVGYAGLALSAWVVTRLHRRTAGPVLILYTASVVFAMAVGAVIVAPRPTSVPHVFFPLLSVALPYQWRSGFVLVPAMMLLTGMLALRRGRQPIATVKGLRHLGS